MSTFRVEVTRTAVAQINPDNCINCGTCRDYCPVDAISEKQKLICHLCNDCTEIKAIPRDEMDAMQSTACTLECPLGLSPQGFINLLKAGKKQAAFELLWRKNPLPGVTGYVCHHPCQEVCKRGVLVDDPMEIRAIQRYLAAAFAEYEPDPYPVTHDEQIAVIGAGPAGLMAAHSLAMRGYPVTVFEEAGEPGGMMIRSIPDFRLDKEIVRKEIARLQKAGIDIQCNTKIGNNYDKLLEDYDRVVVAVGTQVSKTIPIQGAGDENVFTALNIMEKVNSGQKVDLSGNVVVLGGGSVAVDVARVAVRLGADNVTMLCLESGDAIPAHKWELDEAKDEGVTIIESATATKILGEAYKANGIEYAKIENLNPETLSFDKVEGSEETLPASKIIFAIGQNPDLEWPENDKVVFAGDIARGACSVIHAMASGRKAAIQIDNALRGRDYFDYEVDREVEPGDIRYRIYPAVRRKLNFEKPDVLPIEERKSTLGLMEKTLTDSVAQLETYRCLECGYHDIDTEKCIGCGVCSKVCPKGDVITMVGVQDVTA